MMLLTYRRELQLPLASFSCGNPRAFHVGLTLKPSAFTTSPTPHVLTIFLCLVPTILTIRTTATATANAAVFSSNHPIPTLPHH
ncbi:hypothetical protein HanRHA438_Chr04g0165141 [Helianthus annuus]|nr:hypothetical protein HanRHA438_Chr04g0165141 [Helianthus annuus]